MNNSLQPYIFISYQEDISEVRKRLTKVFKKVQERYKYIFKGNEVIELDDTVLSYVFSELQRFRLVDTPTDVKGEAYEEIAGPNLRGDRGKFFIARNVCSMVMEMLFSAFREERPTSPGGIKILDPAVGTEGVLIDNREILARFELSKFNAGSPRVALPPEQLFVERCLDFLKLGGLLGIVLPDSILSNPGLAWLREWIVKMAYIVAGIDLPVETFEPHTGTQTSILILRKKNV